MVFLIHKGIWEHIFRKDKEYNKNHLPKVLYDLESHAKDGRCGLSRNEDIRRYVGKLVEKQTLDAILILID